MAWPGNEDDPKLKLLLTVLFPLLKTLHLIDADWPTATLTVLGSRSSNIGGGDDDVGNDGGGDGGGNGGGINLDNRSREEC